MKIIATVTGLRTAKSGSPANVLYTSPLNKSLPLAAGMQPGMLQA